MSPPASLHPSSDRLVLFLRAEVPAAERRAIVRHLLAGCPACTAVTRAAWLTAPPPAEEHSLAGTYGRQRPGAHFSGAGERGEA